MIVVDASRRTRENVIKMSRMTTAIPSLRGWRRVGAALATACLALLVSAAAAPAAPVWEVTSQHGPQHMPPGGSGQYFVQLYNVGDTMSAGPITVTVDLPAGVTVAAASGGVVWNCAATVIGSATATCESAFPVVAPGTDATQRGAAFLPIVVDVDVVDRPDWTGDAVVTVSGGGALADGITTDSTVFSSRPAGFGFTDGSFVAEVLDGSGAPEQQAGGHPHEVLIDFETNQQLKSDPSRGPDARYTAPDGHIKTLETKLPTGLIGNPQALPRCRHDLLPAGGPGQKGACPANTQVGSISLVLQNGTDIFTPADLTMDIPVFNMIPPKGSVAALAFAYIGQPVWITIELDPANQYAIVANLKYTTEVLTVRAARLRLWGVPADPAHDTLRMDPTQPDATGMGAAFTGAPIKPYLTMPSLCGVPGALQIRADSWSNPGAFTPWQVGTEATMTGCDDARFRFEPSITLQPTVRSANAPTGLDVVLSVPQKSDVVSDATDLYPESGKDAAIPTPPLKDAKVVLPAGMTVSPSSADGLAACTPLQIGLGTNADPACPDASKIGTTRIDTPLLDTPLTGGIYLATQNDNPFGSLLALYLVAKGDGVVIKLPGRIAPDPVTGQLTATFDENPPVPFSKLHLQFKSGPRAPLVTPPTCGVKTTTAEFTAWNVQLPTAQASDSFTIDGNCATGFNPGFTAGTENPSAGKDSPLITRFTRGDSDEELSTIDISLPNGVLGHIADVDLCSDGQASAGTCGAGSLIGRATVGAGPGSNPFYITDGRVHMTGPYKGAPFGLSIVVRAKAGPLDLGNVIVRAAVHVDKRTAALRVVSDPMPRILQGIPLHIRVVDITVDRPGFMFNPTNCSVMSAGATIRSTGGKAATKSSRFQVGDCAALPFAPRMAIRVGGRGRTQRGRTTPLAATVRMAPGHANLRGVRVTLPLALNARLPVIEEACTLAEFEAGNCEDARAGTAVAVTPLLRDPMRGNVYFVRNGSRLPDMFVALRGQGRSSGVAVDLAGRITIPGSKRLRTNFNTVPDVPITKFALRLVSGRNGPIGNTRNLCQPASRRQRVGLSFTGQNGATVHRSQRLTIRGCKKARSSTRAKAKSKAGAKAKAKARR